MAYYHQCVTSFKSTIAVTTTLWWVVLITLLFIIYAGLPVYLVLPCVTFMIMYTIYLWYYSNDIPSAQQDLIDLTNENELKSLQRSCRALEYEWKALGSPKYMTHAIDLVQLLYSLLPWRNQKAWRFDDFVDAANRFCERPTCSKRDRMLDKFDAHFADLPQFEEARTALERILEAMSMVKEED